MKVTCIQLAYPEGESVAQRRARVIGLIGEAADADLVVLPELWPTGYFSFSRYDSDAESLHGETVTTLRDTAAQHGIYLMGGSFIERHREGLSNCAVLVGPQGEVELTYRKIHLFGYQSEEARLLTPGDSTPVVDTPLGTVAMSTCYDLRFPELYRAFVDRGAQMVIVPAAWPKARLEHWRLLVRTRAVEDQTFVIACNGSGVDHGTHLAGHSLIVDPWGTVVAEAGEDEQFLSAALNVAQVSAVRAEFPVLEHRRL